MEPEVTDAVAAPELSSVASPPQDGSAPSPPGSTAAEPNQATPGAPSALPELTPEQRLAIIHAATDDEIKQTKTYQAETSRHQQRLQREADAKEKARVEQAQQNARYANLLTQYRAASPEERQTWLDAHPNNAIAYAEARKWEAAGGAANIDPATIAKNITTNVISHFRTHDDYQHVPEVDWDALMDLDADAFLRKLVEFGTVEKIKQLNAAHKTELAAREKEWQAKYAASAQEVEAVPGRPNAADANLDAILERERPSSKEWQDAYRQKYGIEPTVYA